MILKRIFFDVGYTLINEDAVWQRRFEERAQDEETRRLGFTAEIIRQDVEHNTISRKPQYRSFIKNTVFPIRLLTDMSWRLPIPKQLMFFGSFHPAIGLASSPIRAKDSQSV